MSEEEDRVVIRESWTEHMLGLIFSLLFAPVFGLGLLFFILREIQAPGDLGREMLRLDANSPQVLAVVCSWIGILILAALVWFCCRELQRKLLGGRIPWILDRLQGNFRRGNKEIRPLSSITHILLTGAWVKTSYIYYVTFAAVNAQPIASTFFPGLRDDLFAFGDKGTAMQFADRLASFLHVEVMSA